MLPIKHQPQGPGIPSLLVSRCLLIVPEDKFALLSQFFPFLFLLFPHTPRPPLVRATPIPIHHFLAHSISAPSSILTLLPAALLRRRKKVAVCCWLISHACRLQDASRSHHLCHHSLHTLPLSIASAISSVQKMTRLASRDALILPSDPCLAATAATGCSDEISR